MLWVPGGWGATASAWPTARLQGAQPCLCKQGWQPVASRSPPGRGGGSRWQGSPEFGPSARLTADHHSNLKFLKTFWGWGIRSGPAQLLPHIPFETNLARVMSRGCLSGMTVLWQDGPVTLLSTLLGREGDPNLALQPSSSNSVF